SGAINYIDRKEAINPKNNFKIKIDDTEIDNTERKILSLINKNGTSNINKLCEDTRLKNMIYYEEKLFEKNKKDNLTRYDVNYLFNKYFDKKEHTFDINSFEKIFNKSNKKNIKNAANEKKRVLKRLQKLSEFGFIDKVSDDTYKIKDETLKNLPDFNKFEFTSYDVNKIFPLIREHGYEKTLDIKLKSMFKLEAKEGKRDYEYIKKRIENNIELGTLTRKNGEVLITKMGNQSEDKIKYPHKIFIEKRVKTLEKKSNEFKREKKLLDEQYSVSEALNFSGIIEYIDRKKARQLNNKDEIGLFTNNKDFLTTEDKNTLKEIFDNNQKKKGILWNDIISFDNAWLEKYGVYDSKTKILDTFKLKQAVRSAVNEMLKKENLDKTSVWCADIHYNTDNIHVHVSTVEINPKRKRLKRKYKSLLAIKSKVVNKIMDNSLEYKKINELMRKNIIQDRRNFDTSKEVEMKKLFLEIYKKLPEDKRQWNYNYNTLKDVRPLIDKMSNLYIEKYKKEEFTTLENELKMQQQKLKEAYGVGAKALYENFYNNKIEDLKVRLGNTVLKEIRQYDKAIKYKAKLEEYKTKKALEHKQKLEQFRSKLLAHKSVNALKRSLDKDLRNFQYDLGKDKYKNLSQYEKLQREIKYNQDK
ncbi:MAG: MobP2 family relaxase, partial [Clostridium sp.]|nr:MobP2 family relaxase [Clostridium sp.]